VELLGVRVHPAPIDAELCRQPCRVYEARGPLLVLVAHEGGDALSDCLDVRRVESHGAARPSR
jgi:hypothetical protein